jgi:hypothetical protein
MKLFKLVILFILLFASTTYAQDDAEAATIDPSKPTNLYTQINTLAEYTSNDGFNTYGTRLNFQYAFNPDNLLLAEVPLLHNDGTNKFGLSDVRVRYFNAIKRNISPTVIAIAPFVDITIPTGSFEDGLGGDTWSLAAGAVVGVVLNKNISLFPGANYVYLTKLEESGFGFQTNMSVKFSQNAFLFVNPIVTMFSFDTIWQAEINYNYIITPNKFKVNAGWYPNFTNEFDTFRLGATFFL